jgi:uncharacterized protein
MRVAMRSTFCSMALALATMMAVAGSAHAQSPETLAAADRLIAAQDLTGMMKDMAGKISVQLPPAQQQAYVDALTDPGFIERLKGAARESMAKHLTTEELNALADFYSQPIARSAMAKMGDYMADLMPFIQKEMMDIAQKMQSKK